MAIVVANFRNGSDKCYTKSLHQFDKKQRLIFTGIELPESFEVHFSIYKDGGIGTAHGAGPEGVMIPDEYLETGEYIYAWLYFTEENQPGKGTTTYSVVIPVIKRSSAVPVSVGTLVEGFDLDDDHTLIVVPK